MERQPKDQPGGPTPDQGPGQAPGSAPIPDSDPSRLARMSSKLKEAARWTAPVVGDALMQESGVEIGDNRLELTESQKFGSHVARFALRRGAERMAERRAA